MTAGDRILGRGSAWAAALVLVGVTLAARSAALTAPDIAYFLYSAGRLLDGARLYRDVVDMNPPAIFALNVPIVWVSRLAHVSDLALYRLAAFAAIGGALLFLRRLLGRYGLAERPAERRYVLLWSCVILFPLARGDFGQREHLILALLLPYAALALARLRLSPVAREDALAAGTLVGLALALKPPFVLAWLAIEAWRRWRQRAERWRVTPEAAATFAVAAAYVAAVLALTPDYLRLVGMLGGAFLTYLRSSQVTLLTTPGALLTGFALLAALAARGPGRDAEVQGILAAAMLGSLAAALGQQKDLRYHFYPAFGLATLGLALLAARPVPQRTSARAYRAISRWVVTAIAVVALGRAVVEALGGSREERRRRAEFDAFVEAVRSRGRGEPVAVLSYQMASAFPLVNYAGVRLASRFACLWILPASYWDALTGEPPIVYRRLPEMGAPERLLSQAVSEDLLAARPRLLIILRPFPDRPPYGFRRLNYVAYFGRDPRLAALFAGYQWVASEGAFDLFERVGPDGRRTGPPPSADVPPVPPPPTRGPLAGVDAEMAAGALVILLLSLRYVAVGRMAGPDERGRPEGRA